MLTIRRELKIVNGERGRKRVVRERATPEVEPGRVPRISRLMALAIRFEGLLQTGVVADQTELARLVHITQPRMTQIMNLLHLAPAIQEALLFQPKVTEGKDQVTEKSLRAIAAVTNWKQQTLLWHDMFDTDIYLRAGGACQRTAPPKDAPPPASTKRGERGVR